MIFILGAKIFHTSYLADGRQARLGKRIRTRGHLFYIILEFGIQAYLRMRNLEHLFSNILLSIVSVYQFVDNFLT